MQKDYLDFHFTLAKGSTGSEDDFSKEFIRSLGLKDHGRRSTVDLDSPVIYDFIEKARALMLEEKADFSGCQVINQELIEDNDFHAEWYIFNPIVWLHTSRDTNNLATIKAYKVPQNVNITHGYPQDMCIYVSDKFKAICEEQNLSGLDFVWVKDTGKYRAHQWFVPIAFNAIGRGVDHIWFDPESRDHYGYLSYSTDPVFRRGIWEFEVGQIKNNIVFDNPAYKELIELYSLSKNNPFTLDIESYPRFLRQHLPDTDFAFMWRYESRFLCLNRQARDTLIQNKVITETDVFPVMILDELPEGCLLLDGLAPYPEPLMTPAQVAEKKQLLADDLETHQAIAKPIRSVSIKEALKYLRKVKKDFPNDFAKGLSKAKQQNLPVNVTTNWIQVLSVSNGCSINEECTLCSIDELPDRYDLYYIQLVQDVFPEYPFDCPHIPIAHNIYGDWYSLEDKGPDAEDSRVFQVSHEDFSIVSEWATIPLFILDMLTGSND